MLSTDGIISGVRKRFNIYFPCTLCVIANQNKYDKLIDFRINGIEFDHKTSVLPKGFQKSYQYAKKHKKELTEWLYKNQSQEGRKHLKNRLFIVLYHLKSQQHWKLKAEISLLKKTVDNRLFRVEKK